MSEGVLASGFLLSDYGLAPSELTGVFPEHSDFLARGPKILILNSNESLESVSLISSPTYTDGQCLGTTGK